MVWLVLFQMVLSFSSSKAKRKVVAIDSRVERKIKLIPQGGIKFMHWKQSQIYILSLLYQIW